MAERVEHQLAVCHADLVKIYAEVLHQISRDALAEVVLRAQQVEVLLASKRLHRHPFCTSHCTKERLPNLHRPKGQYFQRGKEKNGGACSLWLKVSSNNPEARFT